MASAAPKNLKPLMVFFAFLSVSCLVAYGKQVGFMRAFLLIIFVSLVQFTLRAVFYRRLSRAKFAPVLMASLLSEMMLITNELALLYFAQSGFLAPHPYVDYLYGGLWLSINWALTAGTFRFCFPKAATVRNLLLL